LLRLAAAEELDEIDLTLRRPGSVRATLAEGLMEALRPGASFSVALHGLGPLAGYWEVAYADGGDTFDFTGLAPGSYRVDVSGPDELLGGWPWPGKSRRIYEWIALPEGETTTLVLAEAHVSPIRIRGRLTFGGVPRGGVKIRGHTEDDEFSFWAETDDEGRYEAIAEYPGFYEVELEGCQFDPAQSRIDLPQVEAIVHDIELPGGSIAGGIQGHDGQTPRHALIAAISADSGVRTVLRTATLKPGGRFDLDGLGPGRYHIVAGPYPWSLWEFEPQDGLVLLRDVELAEGESREGLELHLPTPATIGGFSLRADGSLSLAGEVDLLTADGIWLGPWSQTFVRVNSRYELRGLGPGEYELRARAGSRAGEAARATVKEGERLELFLRLEN
jgi:hypothetical protein